MDLMNKMIADDYRGKLIFGIIAIIIGIIAIVWPSLLFVLLGILILLKGLISLFEIFSQKDNNEKDTRALIIAVVYVVLGLILIFASFLLVSIIMYILAALLILFGLFQLYEMMPIAKDSLKGDKLTSFAVAVIVIILGIIIAIFPGQTSGLIMIIIGVFLIIIGLINLLGAFQLMPKESK